MTETATCGTNVGWRNHPKPCGRPATHVVDGHLPMCANGQSVILEWGHWARAERDEKRLGARAFGVAVELRYLDASLEELIERAERRSASGEWTASPMTRAHFERWAQVFEPPDEEEMRLFDPPVAEVPSAP